MRSMSTWLGKGSQCMVMVAVAAFALGWATTAGAYDELSKSGQTTCYQMERYPLGHAAAGEAVMRDANGEPELLGVLVDDGTGTLVAEANPAFDSNTGVYQDNPVACAGTGQDGDSQKGTAHARIDTGDGRIYDNNTGLTWEKKSDDGGLHDKDNLYTWEEALAYAKTLNNICQKDEKLACATNADCAAVGGVCGFAGKRDWRLPNVRELSSLVNWGIFSDPRTPTPTIWPELNTNCLPGVTVLTGSCTHSDDVTNDEHEDPLPYGSSETMFAADGTPLALRVPMTYWSSTSGDAPGDAWFVDFFTGDAGAHFKDFDFHVDAQAVNPADPPSPANTEVVFAGHARAVRGPDDAPEPPKSDPARDRDKPDPKKFESKRKHDSRRDRR
jgi:hypothetical protein